MLYTPVSSVHQVLNHCRKGSVNTNWKKSNVEAANLLEARVQ